MKRLFIIMALAILSGVIYCQTTPEWLWATQAGGTGNDLGMSIATDSCGNNYITGVFMDIAIFGTTTLTSSGEYDIFIAKLDSNGNYLWAKSAGGATTDHGRCIAIDSSGNSYVTGNFQDSAAFGTLILNSSGDSDIDIFIAKLDTDGNWLWVIGAGGTNVELGKGISTDNNGNSYVTGVFNGIATFGTTSLTSYGSSDIFVAKLDINGNWLWAEKAGGWSDDVGSKIVTDNSGNSYVTGNFQGIATFGNTSLISGSGHYDEDIFIAKLDCNGNWLWAKRAGGTDTDCGYGITIDNNGNSYITGYFTGTATFGTTSLPSSGGSDIFTAKLDTNGNWLWASKAGGANNDYGYGVTTDDVGNSFLTGCFAGTVTFGTTLLTSSGGYDIVVSKIDTNGNWLWASRAGGSDDDYCTALAIDSNGYNNAVGSFRDIATFSMTSLSSSGYDDIFVAKLASDGTFINDDLTPGNTSQSHLHNAYPNPLHRGTYSSIKAEIAPSETGSITIYNLKGQVVESHQLGSGSHSISFNGKDLASGIYFYRLQTPTVNEVKKLILLRE